MLTEAGVSVEVSNRLLEKEGIIPDCPSWLGNLEKLENGVRYRYEKTYDSQKKEIIFTKTDVDWNWLYGVLEPGRYRIIKPVDDFRGTGDFTMYYLGAEFEIE